MDNIELARLIDRLKNGKATPEEKELLEKKWKNALDDNTVLQNASHLERETLKNAMFSNIAERLELRKEQKKIVHFNRAYYRVAAAILIVFLFAGVWYLNSPEIKKAVSSPRFTEIHTNYGERRTVKLPDASSVVLNGNSTLRYAKNWSSSNPREVWIDGEGFFAVSHTENHQKFIVHTPEGLNVEVLGTKFNVKSRDRGSEVLLTEGKVKLNVSNKTEADVILKPGEMATMKENKLSKRAVQDKQYTSWIRSKLYFDKMTLQELAQILKETYGVQVSFQNDELKYRQLSGEISSASKEDILFAIAETFDIEVTRHDDNSVTFSSKLNTNKPN